MFFQVLNDINALSVPVGYPFLPLLKDVKDPLSRFLSMLPTVFANTKVHFLLPSFFLLQYPVCPSSYLPSTPPSSTRPLCLSLPSLLVLLIVFSIIKRVWEALPIPH
jgi:hypothetical protein